MMNRIFRLFDVNKHCIFECGAALRPFAEGNFVTQRKVGGNEERMKRVEFSCNVPCDVRQTYIKGTDTDKDFSVCGVSQIRLK